MKMRALSHEEVEEAIRQFVREKYGEEVVEAEPTGSAPEDLLKTQGEVGLLFPRWEWGSRQPKGGGKGEKVRNFFLDVIIRE